MDSGFAKNRFQTQLPSLIFIISKTLSSVTSAQDSSILKQLLFKTQYRPDMTVLFYFMHNMETVRLFGLLTGQFGIYKTVMGKLSFTEVLPIDIEGR